MCEMGVEMDHGGRRGGVVLGFEMLCNCMLVFGWVVIFFVFPWRKVDGARD